MVVEQILESLQNEEFKPGEKLPSQRDLADMFNVGLSSIREAIKALDVMGYLEITQGRGTFFKTSIPSDDQSLPDLMDALESVTFADLMKAREVLECSAVAFASDSADSNQIKNLQKAVKKLEKNDGSRAAFLEADLAFHFALAQAANNILIYQMLKLLLEKVHTHHFTYFSLSEEMRAKTIDTANQILSFIIQKEGNNGAACMRRHLDIMNAYVTGKAAGKEKRQ